jgi:hypothetical protein
MKHVVLLLMMFVLPSVVKADDSGQCGKSLTYQYVEATRTLTISGTGAMDNYGYRKDSPWRAYSGSIEHIVLNSGLTAIGEHAFKDCSEVVAIDIPDGVTSIGDNAFDDCRSLVSAKMPESLLSIGAYAFSSCESLVDVIIPRKVTSIGKYAFSYCERLSKIIIPSDVKAIEEQTFYSCDALETIIIPYGVKSIGDYAFNSCDRLKSITIPNSVENIGGHAFANCFGFQTVTVPNSVTSLGESAFYNCVGLTSVILSDQLTSIGNKAFHHCRSLKTINIPASVQTIDEEAFTDCNNLKEVRVLAATPPTMAESAFNNYNIVLKVPAGALTGYSNTEPWSKFATKEALMDDDLIVKKCAKPTITYTKDGELVFDCETEGVDFLYNFSSSGSSLGNKAVMTDHLIVTVYAVKSGYANSEPVTAEFTPAGKLGDLNADGKVDVADHVKLTQLIMAP